MTCMVGEGVGVGVAVGVGVGGIGVGVGVGLITDAEADGFADADADAALDAVCDTLLVPWLLLVDDVQPATDSEATIKSTTVAATFLIIRFAFLS